MSKSSTNSKKSSSNTSLSGVIRPPISVVGQKRTIVHIDDDKNIDKEKVCEWLSELGNLLGATELRENITNLQAHLLMAITVLRKISRKLNENGAKEVNKLIVNYTTLASVCEKMGDKMEKRENNTFELYADNDKPKVATPGL